jgi:large subunit ribosomal protein L10
MANVGEKAGEVEQLAELFAKSKAAYVVNYQGTKCESLTKLRRQLRPTGAKMAIVKNTLARRAIKGTGAEKLHDIFAGPVAVIWASKDPVSPAKVITEFAKEASETFSLKSGVVDGSLVSQQEIEALAKLPSKEELTAQLLGLINAAVAKVLQTINAPSASLVRLLGAYKDKLDKQN